MEASKKRADGSRCKVVAAVLVLCSTGGMVRLRLKTGVIVTRGLQRQRARDRRWGTKKPNSGWPSLRVAGAAPRTTGRDLVGDLHLAAGLAR